MCINVKIKRSAAMIHLGKDPDIATKAEWMAYFQYALDDHGPDFGDLEAKIKTSVVMNDKELDADRCYDKWALMEGIHPASLKAVVQIHLDLDQKQLRNSVLQFMVYVKTKLVAQMEFTWAAKSVGLVKAAGEDKPRQMDQAPKSGQIAEERCSEGACEHVRRPLETPSSETEKEAIREKKKAKWANRKPFKPKIFKTLRQPLQEPLDGSCWAEIPGVQTNDLVAALVDSGIDVARDKGLSGTGVIRLGRLLTDFEDIFCLEFQKVPPIAVEPLKVRFIVDATPTTCETRRYSLLLKDYLRSHLTLSEVRKRKREGRL
ncbi:hypothetical protein DYB28_001496 [Aphanomyces astaci]|uniref:Uncharacterized protein n=1 Tax=Aphanomyces astaci TaxID=112090 RepID=A0A9X8EBI7_APHAT|nr:hypothetical protein DYB28_001496 [Aphanomyces astaci]